MFPVPKPADDKDKYVEHLFKKILLELKNKGLDKESPRIFIVYAHNSKKSGAPVANAQISQQFITWLNKDLNLNLYSDHTKDGNTTDPLDKENTACILHSQLRLLVKGKFPLDYVIVCASELLKQYELQADYQPYLGDLMKGFNSLGSVHRKDWVLCIHTLSGILQKREKASGDDFHHSMTELAFLQMRSQGDTSYSVVPLVVSGDPKEVLPSFVTSHDTRIEEARFHKRSTFNGNETYLNEGPHVAFFKLLERLFLGKKNIEGVIKEYQNKYKVGVERIRRDKIKSTADVDNFLKSASTESKDTPLSISRPPSPLPQQAPASPTPSSDVKRQLAIGLTDFDRRVLSGNRLVDKSDGVAEFFIDQTVVKIFLRPRRFGKSTFLSMIRSFADASKSKKDSDNPFQKLKVWGRGKEVTQHYRKYPVLFVSFQNIKGSDFETAKEKIKKLLSEIYEEHRKIVFDRVFNMDAETYEAAIIRYKRIISMENVTDRDMYYALSDMTKYLHLAYDELCIVLIDEYDTPVLASVTTDKNYYTEMNTLLGDILSPLLKENPHLYMAALVGIVKIAKTGWFSGLNHMPEYDIFNPQFATSFGFLESEVEELLSSQASTETESKDNISFLKKRFGGYYVGDSQMVCNPWSVCRSVDAANKTSKLGDDGYWAAGTENDLIRKTILNKKANNSKELDEIKKDFSALLKPGGVIEKEIDKSIIFSEISTNLTQFWSCLLFTGWLTSEEPSPIQAPGPKKYNLRIPNQEVRDELCAKLMPYIGEVTSLSEGPYLKQSTTENTAPLLASKGIFDNKGTNEAPSAASVVEPHLSVVEEDERDGFVFL